MSAEHHYAFCFYCHDQVPQINKQINYPGDEHSMTTNWYCPSVMVRCDADAAPSDGIYADKGDDGTESCPRFVRFNSPHYRTQPGCPIVDAKNRGPTCGNPCAFRSVVHSGADRIDSEKPSFLVLFMSRYGPADR